MHKTLLLLLSITTFLSANAQSTKSLVSEVSLDSLVKTVREFSGEDSTVVNDSTVRIVHRVSKRGNNLAADYLVNRLENYGLQVEVIDYRNGGRNIVGTLLGKTNPDSVFIISAHYDAVADYCADDNASGSATVLEAARIMSKHCFHNTIRFAFWDEEELGLIGSKYYADSAFARGHRILGVLNMDMMGYDGDSNKVFDIHTNNNPENQVLKDTVLYLLDTLKLDLVPNVINPGTTRSDHAAFWKHRYPAVFCGESFIGGDPNPAYHSANDRINLFDLPYYHKLAKLAIGTIVELADVIPTVVVTDTVEACHQFTYRDTTFLASTVYVDSLKSAIGCDSLYVLDVRITSFNTAVQDKTPMLYALDSTVSKFQWFGCYQNGLTTFSSDTFQSFRVPLSGSYAAELSKNGCKDTTDCYSVTLLDVVPVSFKENVVFPNPTTHHVQIVSHLAGEHTVISIYTSDGTLVGVAQTDLSEDHVIQLPDAAGLYYIYLQTPTKMQVFPVIKLP